MEIQMFKTIPGKEKEAANFRNISSKAALTLNIRYLRILEQRNLEQKFIFTVTTQFNNTVLDNQKEQIKKQFEDKWELEKFNSVIRKCPAAPKRPKLS
ncbi:MAG: hypothetical protein JWM09_1473 [Francisellaceae bacterium]|nr:hypothetical protein [Francisellaceae bacterium]